MHAPIQKLAFFQKCARSHVSRSLFDISWIKERMKNNVHVPWWLLLGLLLSGATRLTNKLSPPGVESMLYCTATQHTLVRENVWKQPIQVLFLYAHPQQTIWQFSMNFWMRLYLETTDSRMDPNSIWNCFPEIARFWSILQISQCAFAGLIQSSSQSFQGCQPKTEQYKSYPWPSTIATSGFVFFPQKKYISNQGFQETSRNISSII